MRKPKNMDFYINNKWIIYIYYINNKKKAMETVVTNMETLQIGVIRLHLLFLEKFYDYNL